MSDWSYVNTKASYYSGKGIKFLGIPAIDLKHYPLNVHFKGKVNRFFIPGGSPGLVVIEETRVPLVVGSNPNSVYWMDILYIYFL